MPKGDYFYNNVDGWRVEDAQGRRTPLSESTDPYDQAVWNILRQIRIEPSYTDEDLQAIVDAAETGAAGALAAQADAEIPPRPPGWVGPWPRMTKAVPEKQVFKDGVLYTEPAVPAGPDWDGMNAAINSLGLAYVQDPATGEWGYQRQSDLLKTAAAPTSLIFGTKAEAEAEVAANGGVVTRRSDGFWGVEDAPLPREVAEERPPTVEEVAQRLFLSGQKEKAQQLLQEWDDITSGGGRMTRAQAASFITGDLFKPEEIPAVLAALMGGPEQQGIGPFQQAMQPKSAEQVLAESGGKQWFDAAGNPIATPSFAAALATSPFPTMPFGMLPGAQEAIGRNRQQATAAGQGPFTTAFAPTNVEEFDPNYEGATPEAQAAIRAELTKRQAEAVPTAKAPPTSFTEAIQADLTGVTNAQRSQLQSYTQDTRVEDFDPNYEGATPEAQAAIRAEFERRQRTTQAQGPTSFQDALTPAANIGDVLRMAQQGDVAGARANAESLVQQGFAARMGQTSAAPVEKEGPPYEPPFDISVLSPEMQAAIRAGTAHVSQTGPGVGGPGVGGTQDFQVVNKKGVYNLFTPESSVPPTQPAQPLTFAQALAQINERRRHQQLLRKPQGKTVFA